jgi:hypothetical protein
MGKVELHTLALIAIEKRFCLFHVLLLMSKSDWGLLDIKENNVYCYVIILLVFHIFISISLVFILFVGVDTYETKLHQFDTVTSTINVIWEQIK